MKTIRDRRSCLVARPMGPVAVAIAICVAASGSLAQVPPGQAQPAAPAVSVYTPDELQTLVGNIALYPDDLLGLVLPASTTPIEIVKAQRFLAKYAQDKNLKPDPSIPQPVLGLMAYPDVVNLMGDNLEWTEALGHAVQVQQQDVFQAIQIFRRKAQAAGNLNSDDKQTIIVQQEVVKIVPAQPEVIYVPQYQPTTVVVQQSAPVVTYSAPAPVYYAPGAAAVGAAAGYMAGIATAYGMNWGAGSVYYGAPYGAQAAYLQDQRMEYAEDAREDWQEYGKDAREDWQDYGQDRQDDRQQAVRDNRSQRQNAISGGQAQRQNAAATTRAQRPATGAGQRPVPTANMPQGAQSWQAAAANRQGGWQGAGPSAATSGLGGGSGIGQGASSRASAAPSSFGGVRPSASTSGFGASRSGGSFGGGGGAFGGVSSGAQSRTFSDRGSRSFSGAGGGGGGGGRSRGGRR